MVYYVILSSILINLALCTVIRSEMMLEDRLDKLERIISGMTPHNNIIEVKSVTYHDK